MHFIFIILAQRMYVVFIFQVIAGFARKYDVVARVVAIDAATLLWWLL